MSQPNIFASDNLLSFAVPEGTNCLQDSDEMIELMTEDEGFGFVAIPFDMEATETEALSQLIYDLSERAGVDIDECDRLDIENDDIVGGVYTYTDEDGVIYVFGLCGNNEIGFAFQITALSDYEDDVQTILETMSIEEE